MIAVVLALLVAVVPAAAGPIVPGTTLRLGTPLGAAPQDFDVVVVPGDSTAAARTGRMRFFGLDARATLTFRDSLLVEAEFQADSASPAGRAYVEDELTRAGYRRRCARWEPDAHVCDWIGRTEVHLEVTPAVVTARVTPAPETPPQRAEVVPAAEAPAPGAGSGATPGPGGRPERETGASQRTARETAITLGPQDEPPRILDSCVVVRPEAARRAGIFGRVVVHATVDTTGAVTDAAIYKGVPELNAAAMACALRYRFQPYSTEGRVRTFATLITIRFTR